MSVSGTKTKTVDNVSCDLGKSYHNTGVSLWIWKNVLECGMTQGKSIGAEREKWPLEILKSRILGFNIHSVTWMFSYSRGGLCCFLLYIA